MIYLSAQTDKYYFYWQLQIQLFNFNSMGITRDQIHVLLNYNEEKGITETGRQFVIDNKDNACFFFYPDTRKKKEYGPSAKVHLIASHLEAYPEMEQASFFLQDCDVVFKELPDFDTLLKDDIWYFSNTIAYMGKKYLDIHGPDTQEKLCRVLNIDPQLIVNNDENTGGAQILFKNSTAAFWRKIEADSNTLHEYICNHSTEFKYIDNTTGKPVYLAAWCSEMWAVLWNTWHFGYTGIVSKELDFSWASDNLRWWNEKKIYHNTGGVPHQKHFNKGKFTHEQPYFSDHREVSPELASIRFVEILGDYRKTYYKQLIDVTFCLILHCEQGKDLECLYATIDYLQQYFSTNIAILEIGDRQYYDKPFHPDIRYYFSEEFSYASAKAKNRLLEMIHTPLAALWEVGVIVDPSRVYDAVIKLRYDSADFCYPYDGDIKYVDDTLCRKFIETPDFMHLVTASTEQIQTVSNNFHGAVLFQKKKYQTIGGENENITMPNIAALECYFRSKIMGFRSVRITGPIFHLKTVLSAQESTEKADLIEFIYISSQDKKKLTEYIGNHYKKDGRLKTIEL